MGFAGVLLQPACGLTHRRSGRIIPRIGPGQAGRLNLDDKLHQMLRDLRRALSEAISDSTEVSRTLRKIREEGYSLYLLVDCKREANVDDALSLTPAHRYSSSERDPAFQINGNDLSFLRSIGIDPTRRLRRRRRVLED